MVKILPQKLYKVIVLFTGAMLLFVSDILSQDIQFSQFYNVPLYVSPAFAGSTHSTRASFHQRLQWPGVDAKYTTSVISLDHYVPHHKLGLGLMAIKDYQGSRTFSSTDIQAAASYEINLNQKVVFRPGVQVGIVSRYINYAELLFPSMFDNKGQVSGPDPADYGKQRKYFVDISSGGILFSKNAWLGFTAHHINTPNQSFYNGKFADPVISRLPLKYSFTGGYKILIGNNSRSYQEREMERSFTPTFHYKAQGKSDQLDIGVYFLYDYFVSGIWYRGIPIKKYDHRFQNNESIILFLGLKWESWRVGYSYDFVISKLASSRANGAHELNLTYIVHHRYKKKKPVRRMPCPTF